jgi:hypothetical protein
VFVFFYHKTFKTHKTTTMSARNRLPPEAAGWRASDVIIEVLLVLSVL